MFRYLIRRLLWAGVLFFVITIVTFVIFFMIPVNPAKQACGQRATPTCIKNTTKTLGLDRPVYIQYLKFVNKLVIHHNLGRSFVTRQSVNTTVLNAAPVTASLVFGGALLWMLVAMPIGILSALRSRSLLDRVSMVFVLVGISAHPVWIGLILAYVVGFKLGWTPITGYCDFFNPSTDCGGPVQWAHHMILPWITFSILFAALYVRMIRAFSPMIDRQVTLFPEPDSPTMPSVLPFSTWNVTPSTAFTMPSSVRKCVRRSLTSRSATATSVSLG
jgi:peptide/nickel transport system permease protein